MTSDEIQVKKSARRRIWIESIALFFIIASPFVFKAHDYFSRDPEATLSFIGITIDNNGFNNLNAFAWFFVSKFIPLYLLFIWFFTCKHWWYHILLIPICMYAFQLFEVLVSPDLNIDTKNVMWLLPVCMVVIPFVYFVRLKIYDKYVHGIDLEAMDAELQYYKNKEKEELKKVGLNLNSDYETSLDPKLSDQVPKKTLSRLFHSIQHSLKSLF
ncbi:hypothetical protein OZ410_11700 [Robiginitalea sp. M366]|uniref:hypothetical protein n=1 Tax=Robiginitalea aestuariiviva TaxID=3036903 RepID=UPI00240E1E14|nr:hypothetical protein [Robiginitalea aestuariiviva]MDG1572983.1 hypothetical protein [Robiginitalea aestuariiviva]